MRIILNRDSTAVHLLLRSLEQSGGYCPCRSEKTEENICLCREFREQVNNPEFEGYCRCTLFYKEK